MGGDGDEVARLAAERDAARAQLRDVEDALRRSEQNFEAFVRAMPVPVLIHRDTRFVLVNRAFTDVFGYSEAELVGTSILDLVHGDDRSYVLERVSLTPHERAGMKTREHQILHKEGGIIPVEVTPVPVSFRGELLPMGVVHDLRERKRLEAQLITADRLASLGRLSAAVGHEINNPLAYVLGSVGLVERELAQGGVDPDRTRQLSVLVANVREGAERIRTIVQDLKALSREPTEVRGLVDLGHVLDLCAAMAELEVRPRARLVKDYAGVPATFGSEARLGQVFLNLLINAAQAIPEGNAAGNEIRLEARVLDADQLAVDVVDTGTGIPDELVHRIFEPFVTSKSGAGTGLGLSISQHIVTSLGGTISVTPNVPRGTRFRVVLPRADAATGGARTVAPSSDPAAPAIDAHARFLVVDDEPQLAQVIAVLLSPRAVDVALGGQAAIDRLNAGSRYDVILCDLHMADVTGMDVYDHVVQHALGLEKRMIFMTGGGVTPRARDFAGRCGCPILDKPFDPGTLEATIAAVLARAG